MGRNGEVKGEGGRKIGERGKGTMVPHPKQRPTRKQKLRILILFSLRLVYRASVRLLVRKVHGTCTKSPVRPVVM